MRLDPIKLPAYPHVGVEILSKERPLWAVLIIALILFMPMSPTAKAQTGQAPQSSPVAADPSDPAEVKRRFVQTINSAIKKAEAGLKTPYKTKKLDGTFATYHAEYTGEMSYDIKKTDSLVSPYLGVVSWKILWYYNGQLVNGAFSLDAHYAYQDGQWVFKDLVRRRPSIILGGSVEVPAEEYLPLFK